MSEQHPEIDAANDPTLTAAEADGRPAFAVDGAGEIAWAGAAARTLLGAGALDPATRRTLGRMAASGSGGLLRLRLGALGRLAPIAFQARPIARLGSPGLLAIEGLARIARRMPDLRAEPAEAPAASFGARDIAAEEGAHPGPDTDAETTGEASLSFLDQDAPPDPRQDLTRAVEARVEEPRPEEPASANAAAVAPVVATPDPFRFAFEIDAASRISLLSPELERAVGPNAGAQLGRGWDDAARELGLDPDGLVAAALARRGAWTDIGISWPLGDGRRLPLSLSALPMFDRGRAFVGFRGLGRSAGDPVVSGAASLHAADAQPEAPAVSIAEASAGSGVAPTEAVVAPPEPNEARPADPVRYEPPILIEAPVRPSVFEGNVVPLRDMSPRLAGLSSSEVSAFDEIARRLQGLGARSSDEVKIDAPAPADAPHADVDDQKPLPFAAGPDELIRLIDRLPVGALVLRGGEIAHANRAALELLGCREFSELAGRATDTLFAEALPQDREAPAGVMRLIAANGGEVEVDARLSTISWGGAPATLVTLRRPDATAAAARETQQRERELAAALDVATDGVMTLDGAGRILSVNRGAEALFGFEARDVVGSLFTLSLAPESRRAAFDCLDRLKSDTTATEGGVEALGLSRHGGAVPLMITIGRIEEAGGGKFCALLRDIGPWKRAEEELIAARRHAERANGQKSEFLAKVGHEIRTPLNAILGFAEVMMEERFGPVGSPRYKDYLKDIHTSGGHLVKMVDDLLDITGIETGRMKLDFGPVDLNEIASQAAALLQPQANRDHVIIRTSLARGLPMVLADRRSIRQIMTNLASNAVKLSRPGGQVIVATAMTDGGQAVFRVRDAGAGLSKQDLARAFEPFRPLAVADNDTGFGLGLPLTRALAEANEAALALQSELGHGTLAEVTFPASRVLAS